MAPALSELPEDDEEEQSAGVTGSSPSTTDYDKQPSESSSFSLARAETLMICYSKVLVLLVIAIFAAAIGTVTYYLVYNQEDSEYHAKVSRNCRRKSVALIVAKVLRFLSIFYGCTSNAQDNLPLIHLSLTKLLSTLFGNCSFTLLPSRLKSLLN